MINLESNTPRRRCAKSDCREAAGFYGVCLGHEPEFVREEFDRFVSIGIADPKNPPCYPSMRKWMEYVVAFAHSTSPERRTSVRIEHCRDCTPAYRDEMTKANSCEHPETVFIRPETNNGGVIGVPMKNPKDPRRWEQAMMGMMGAVVSLPAAGILESTMRLSYSVKKKVGRPKKTDEQ